MRKKKGAGCGVLLVGVGAVVILGNLVTKLNSDPPSPEAAARPQESRVTEISLSDSAREQVWIIRGQDAVRAKLKDPDSAKFRGMFFHRGTDGTPVSCGEVNAKNGLGGYDGYQRYVSAASAKLTFLESEVDDFEKAWKRFCGGR